MSSILDELAASRAQSAPQQQPAPAIPNTAPRARRPAAYQNPLAEVGKDLSAFAIACAAMTVLRTMLYANAPGYFWLYQHALPWTLVAVAIWFDRTNQYLPMRGIAYGFAAYVLSPRVATWLVVALTQGKLW